jgi:ABC-type multidrug transport system ATPase subunit
LLLDDVLSAVDAHTSLKIYTDCLQGPLLRGRTVILVSHHVALVAAGAHYLVALENGRIKYQGLPSVYLATESKNDGEEPDEEIKLPAVAFARNKALLAVAESAPGSTDVSSASEAESDSDSEDDDNAVPTISKPAKKMIEDEKREVGRVDRSVWMLYLGANGGAFYFAVFASIFVGSKLLAVGESLWLAIWSRSYDTESIDQSHTVYFYLSIYAGELHSP